MNLIIVTNQPGDKRRQSKDDLAKTPRNAVDMPRSTTTAKQKQPVRRTTFAPTRSMNGGNETQKDVPCTMPSLPTNRRGQRLQQRRDNTGKTEHRHLIRYKQWESQASSNRSKARAPAMTDGGGDDLTQTRQAHAEPKGNARCGRHVIGVAQFVRRAVAWRVIIICLLIAGRSLLRSL